MPGPGLEPLVALHWLNSVLVPDTTLLAALPGGLHNVRPPGVVAPFGIVRMETAAEDLIGYGGVPIWVPMRFQTNVYDYERGDYSRLAPPASRIYVLLQAGHTSTADGVVYSCHRVNVNASWETVGDVVERYITQTWEIEATAT